MHFLRFLHHHHHQLQRKINPRWAFLQPRAFFQPNITRSIRKGILSAQHNRCNATPSARAFPPARAFFQPTPLPVERFRTPQRGPARIYIYIYTYIYIHMYKYKYIKKSRERRHTIPRKKQAERSRQNAQSVKRGSNIIYLIKRGAHPQQ